MAENKVLYLGGLGRAWILQFARRTSSIGFRLSLMGSQSWMQHDRWINKTVDSYRNAGRKRKEFTGRQTGLRQMLSCIELQTDRIPIPTIRS